jgi:hypothetical protein
LWENFAVVTEMHAETAIHRRVNDARAGHDPTLLGRCASGWAVFGHQQFVHGYLLLLPDPVVPDLNALTPERIHETSLKIEAWLRERNVPVDFGGDKLSVPQFLDDTAQRTTLWVQSHLGALVSLFLACVALWGAAAAWRTPDREYSGSAAE